MDNQGLLSLPIRPLTLRLHSSQNERLPTDIDRDPTLQLRSLMFSIAWHCRGQMAVLTLMRAVLPCFINQRFRHRPFIFTLTDLHLSNSFVDTDWNIECLIDLEWARSLRMEMMCPLYWLSNRGVNQLTDKYLTEFNESHQGFKCAFESEERLLCPASEGALVHTSAMERRWETGSFWCFCALESTRGTVQYLQPAYPPNGCPLI